MKSEQEAKGSGYFEYYPGPEAMDTQKRVLSALPSPSSLASHPLPPLPLCISGEGGPRALAVGGSVRHEANTTTQRWLLQGLEAGAPGVKAPFRHFLAPNLEQILKPLPASVSSQRKGLHSKTFLIGPV